MQTEGQTDGQTDRQMERRIVASRNITSGAKITLKAKSLM